MKPVIDLDFFAVELNGWTLRGIPCALPSAALAVMVGFDRPVQIAAMLLGVGFYIVAFALFSASTWMRATTSRRRFVDALKVAAWIKVVALGITAALWVAAGLGRSGGTDWLARGVTPDIMLGSVALELVGNAGRFLSFNQLARVDSFAWTGLATIVQGALLGIALVVLAVAVLGGWRSGDWLKRRIASVQCEG